MKKSFIIVSIVILVVIIFVVGAVIGIKQLIDKSDKDKLEKDEVAKISNIKSFYFSYSNGYAMNAYTRYEINKVDGKYVSKIKQYGKSDEEAQIIEISEETVRELERILNKYEVTKWDGFKESDQDVMDGDSFSCSIHMEDGKNISASGYMVWPTHYRDVVSELDSFFLGIIK